MRVESVWTCCDLYTYSTCNCNLLTALYKRFEEPAEAALERMEEAGVKPSRVPTHPLWTAARSLSRKLGRQLVGLQPLTSEAFLLTVFPRLRKSYAKALANLTRYKRWWASVTPFVKVEKYEFYLKLLRIPRPIQPRSFEYRAFAGKYFKVIENNMKGWAFPDSLPFMAKGRNAYQLAQLFVDKWNKFTRPVAISLDLSKFDGTIHRGLKHLENLAFAQMSRHPDWRACLRAQERPTTRVMLPIYAGGKRVWGKSHPMDIISGRCSGDPQTGCGNTLIMAIVCRVIFTMRCEIFANGDDTVVIVEEGDEAEALASLHKFALFGLDVKLESIARSLDTVFWCQSYLWEVAGKWCWVRHPRRVLNTLLANEQYTPKNWKGLLAQIAEAELASNPMMPVVGPICEWVVRNFKRKGVFQHRVDTIERSKPMLKIPRPSGYKREEFTRRFNMEVDSQISLEQNVISALQSGHLGVPVDWINGTHPLAPGLGWDKISATAP